jgi:hypothetical protein
MKMKLRNGMHALLCVLLLMIIAVPVSAHVDEKLLKEGKPPKQDLNVGDYKNIKLVSQIPEIGNGGEGLAMKLTKSGKRIMYVANESGPKCFSVVDVTDPKQPKVIKQFDVPSPAHCNSLDVSGNLLIVANQVEEQGQKPAGVGVYDVSEAENPKQVSFFDTSGPQSRGAHYVWLADGRYAHISSGAPDFVPKRPQDNQIYLIVDLIDPNHPKEVGRWWFPGTKVGDPEPAPQTQPKFDQGVRLHNVLVYPDHPDRAYLGYLDGGTVILDISDITHPKTISIYDTSPPLNGFTHTAFPLFSRNLMVVSDESITDHGADMPKRIWMFDISSEKHPMPISSAPLPANMDELMQQGGRFGAHNVFENVPDEPTFKSDTLIFTTFFNGGLRVYDTSDPYRLEEVAYAVPKAPAGSPVNAIQINDCYVDDRGYIYATDRLIGGVYIFQLDFSTMATSAK